MTAPTRSTPQTARGAGSRPTPVPTGPRPRIGRIPVLDVQPLVDGGRYPTKAVVGETVEVSGAVFREGHDAVAATLVVTGPDGSVHASTGMTPVGRGTDRFVAHVTPDREGRWLYRVEGWADPYGTWEHDATIKVEADIDTELMLEEGARVLERALLGLPSEAADAAAPLHAAVGALRSRDLDPIARLAAGTSSEVVEVLGRYPLRDHVSPGTDYVLLVQRDRALFSSWYEFFPRSEGAYVDPGTGQWVSGTLTSAQARLPKIAAMGFDVVYLTPVHPIGTTNRKGPNNTLTAGPNDPGSPYGIGSPDGGHDAIHPDLGTWDDFDAFVRTSRDFGLEVALDLALQCSPDHPWVTEHPEWFTTRADGSIAYAENPPKKYQDIYPTNFDNDPAGIYAEVLRVVELWISHGVKMIRVDNPHTKPVEFWEWLIAVVGAKHPDVIWLSEAFTRPAMMHTLAKVGFQQSYTYFAWRESKYELTEYVTELSGQTADYMRPNFWPTTHDILTPQMQYGGPAMFKLRAVLAATMSPSWGIYSGYELIEHAARPGAQEQLDNEKYEYKPRDWAAYEDGGPKAGWSIAPYLTQLNRFRREHPALQRQRNVKFHATESEEIIAYSRLLPADQSPTGEEDALLVVVNLDPHVARETTIHVNMPDLGLDWHETYDVTDLFTGDTWTWGAHTYVRLDPYVNPAHVLHLKTKG